MSNTTLSPKPFAIVTGRNYASRLGMVRAAGMAGCDVVVVQTQLEWVMDTPIDIYSKYVLETKIAREPHADTFIDTLMGYRDEQRSVIILPTDDWTAAVVDTHLDTLAPHFLTPHVGHRQSAMLRIMDKDYQKILARAAGANVAEGWVCRYAEGEYMIPEEITFPCFTKPVESHTGALKPYLKRCDNREQLKALLQTIGTKFKKDILVEEYHHIDNEYAVLGVSFGDNSLMPAYIHMSSDNEGVAATGSVHPMAHMSGMEEILERFMAKTQLTGLFDIDLYESEGKIYFNELNTRFGASGFAVTKGFANLPEMFIRHLMGEEAPASITNDDTVKTFVNEKICFDMLYLGQIGYSEYKRQLKNANIHFISQPDDPAPGRLAAKETRLLWLRNMVWGIRRKLKRDTR